MQATAAPDMQQAIRTRDFAQIRDVFGRWEPSAVAAEIRPLPVEDQAVVFRLLPRKCAASVFEFLELAAQERLLKALAQEQVAAILNEMAADDRTALLEELPAAATKQMLAVLTSEERAVALSLLGYPAGSIGRLMTPHYIVVHRDWTALQVLDDVRAHGRDSETLEMLYVTDDHGVLIDDIRLREFLLCSTDKRVADLMDYKFVTLNAADPEEVAIGVFKREDRKALPVIDSTGVLIGIVTLDDVLRVAENQATREIQKIGGSEALDEPYMQIAIARMVKKRAGWLVILFLGEMLTATAMGFFEGEIEKAVVLALFVPLIISSGGNSGSQATTLVIRAMALGEIRLRDWWRVIRRELAAGLALGTILGVIGISRICLWHSLRGTYGPHYLIVALTIGCSLVGVVMFGTTAGSMLPFLLRRCGLDPASASAPFVATLVDVTGLIIYFSVASIVLKGVLL